MSSFKATFETGGKKVNVLNCNFSLKQETDATGRPSSITRGGKFNLTVEATGDTTFFEWMTNNFEKKSGTITFFKKDENAKLVEAKFTDGYLVAYTNNFDATGDNPMTETFTISARSIELGSGKHENEWVQ